MPELWIFVTAACLFSCSAGSVATYLAVNWGRDRQEEADQQRRENAIEHGLKLAQENQRLEERISGDTPAINDLEIEVPGFMADSGYRAPVEPADYSGIPLSDFWSIRCESSGASPIAMTGVRDVDAQDRELTDIYAIPVDRFLPCGWSNGDTVCGDPSAGTVTWPGQGPVDLCAVHYAWAREEVER